MPSKRAEKRIQRHESERMGQVRLRQEDTEDKHSEKLQHQRIRQAILRQKETIKKRGERLQNQRIRQARMRQEETEEKRSKRLQDQRRRQARLRQEKTEEKHSERLQQQRKRQRKISNPHYSGSFENLQHKNIVPTNMSPITVLIPNDSSPQPPPINIQKKQTDDQQVIDKKQMDTATKSMVDSSQISIRQHRIVTESSQTNISRSTLVRKPQHEEKHIFVVVGHQQCVMSNLASLWKKRKLCDASISNGSSSVLVHKLVLSAICPKLLSVFSTNITSQKFLQIKFPEDVSTQALNAFAEYMYNGHLDMDPDILHQLKIIGKQLDMKEFEQLCDSYIPSTISWQPILACDVSEMQASSSNSSNIAIPTVQPSLPSSSIKSVTAQSDPSVTTQANCKAELAQVKNDTATVFEQKYEVDTLDASKSDNPSNIINSTVKTEPVGLEYDRHGEQNNEFNSSISNSSQIQNITWNPTVEATTDLILPFSDTTDSDTTTNTIHGKSSKLKSNVFESSLVPHLSPVSCIEEKMCSQFSPKREKRSKSLNRTMTTTQSLDTSVISGSNESVYPVGFFTVGGDILSVANVKNRGLYKTNDFT